MKSPSNIMAPQNSAPWYHSLQPNSDPNSTRVVIVTHTRSGSSFCGEAFNRNEDCFYWFEPISGVFQHLYGMKVGQQKSDPFSNENGSVRSPARFEHSAISTHLHNLLHCRLDALPVEVLTDFFIVPGYSGILPKKLKEIGYAKCLKHFKPGFGHSAISGYKCNLELKRNCSFTDGVDDLSCAKELHGPLGDTYNISVPDELQRAPTSYAARDQRRRHECLRKVKKNTYPCLLKLNKQCKSSNIRATKLVRIFLETAKYLLQKDPYVKFMYYVRDPRGVLESRFRRANRNLQKGANVNILAASASGLCETMTTDYAVFEELSKVFPQNFMILKYELLATKTEEALFSIYDFIGQDIPAAVRKYFQHATAAKKEGLAMETFRQNATKTTLQWRSKLRPEIQDLIENICRPALEKFGYA